MLQCHYIAKITENISVTVLSFCADYIKQAAHLCFGNNVHAICLPSLISHSSRIIILAGQFGNFYFDISFSPCLADVLIRSASHFELTHMYNTNGDN